MPKWVIIRGVPGAVRTVGHTWLVCYFQYGGGGAQELPFPYNSGRPLELGGIWAGTVAGGS